MTSSSVAIVVGTRPEIIKVAGIVRALGTDARVLHSGQHTSPEMARQFLEELQLGQPDLQLGVQGRTRGAQLGEVIAGLDAYFADHRPAAVVVQGDTNTTVAGALAANARGIPLVHIEAGLRSRDRRMPEEHNRVVTDHLADTCCAPTDWCRQNLAAEGIAGERVVVTGNTVVDAVHEFLPPPAERKQVVTDLGLDAKAYILATMHRPENVDDARSLGAVLHELGTLPLPVVMPLHPRTRDRVDAFGLHGLLAPITVIEPVGYRTLLALAAEAALLVSDSGGLVEEASVLKRPIVVVRRSTERPEVLGTFAELVRPSDLGAQVRLWLADGDERRARLLQTPSPYGDGKASERCVAAIRRTVARPA